MATNPILAQTESGSNNSGSSDLDITKVAQIALTQSALATQKTKADLEQGQATMAALGDDVTSSIVKQGEAEGIIRQIQGTADMQAQITTNEILNAAGGTEYQAELTAGLKDSGQKVIDLANKHADIMDDELTGFYPLDSIINSFRAMPTESALKEANNQKTAVENQIQSISSAQDYFHRTNENAKQTVTEATIAAEQEQIAAKFQGMAAQQKMSNWQSNANILKELESSDSRFADTMIKSHQLETDKISMDMSKARLDLQRTQFDQSQKEWAVKYPQMIKQAEMVDIQLQEARDPKRRALLSAQRDKNLSDLQTLKAARSQQVEAIRQAQGMLGGTPDSAEVIEVGLQDSVTSRKYQELFALGSQARPTMGSSAAETLQFLANYDTNGTVPVTPALSVIKQAKAVVDGAGTAGFKQGQIDVAYNQEVAKIMKDAASNIKAGDRSNPYQAPSMEILGRQGAVKGTKLWKDILKPRALKEVVPQDILTIAAAEMNAGNISPDEAAAGITTLFKAAAAFNNESQGGFRKVGLAEYNQTGYNTFIDRPVNSFLEYATGQSKHMNPISVAKNLLLGNEDVIAAKMERAATETARVDLTDEAAVRQYLVAVKGTVTYDSLLDKANKEAAKADKAKKGE